MHAAEEKADTSVDIEKEHADHAGIKSRGSHAVIYETWKRLKVRGQELLTRTYFGADDLVLSCKMTPFWHGRSPVISASVKKVANAIKGRPPISGGVFDLQLFANDTINEAADSAHFSAMPIVMTDPLKNPRVESMVLGLGAVWQTSPNDTQFAQFPQLWKDGLERADAVKQQIFQTLGVNPAMIPQQSGGQARRRNQAELAMEQTVDILTTADACTILEEGVLTPMVQMVVELDYQFRDDDLVIRVFGELGQRVKMETIPPQQLNRRYEYRWFGVEAARNAAQMQAQSAWLNVVKGVPPEMYGDYELNLAPVLVQGTETVWGPRLAPLIFRKKTLISVDPGVENEMLSETFPVATHPADDDQTHLMSHLLAMRESGDPSGVFREHIMKHQAQMQAKAMQAMGQRPAGSPGMTGGGGQAGPGAGGPRSGAQPMAPRGGQQPPGAIHKDQMPRAGVVQIPRKMA
jgi:hypothetical protein